MNQRRKTGNKDKQAIQDKAEQAGVSRGDKTQTLALNKRAKGRLYLRGFAAPGTLAMQAAQRTEASQCPKTKKEMQKWRHGTQFERTGDQSEGK